MLMEVNQNSQISQDSSIKLPSDTKEVSKLIRKSYQSNSPIEIIGSGSKKNIGKPLQASTTISLSNLSGIIDYKPEELYIKVKAGTPLRIIEEELKKNKQFLAFDPIDFGHLFIGSSKQGTAGGAISTNLSGPRRFTSGSARDHILGFKGVNGKGEIIKSGGNVVKNVTGYDLSKLVTGAYGTLVVLTEVTLKVLPLSESNETLVIHDLHLEHGTEILSSSINYSNEISGAVFFPENTINIFKLNDLKEDGSITALRLEGSKKSRERSVEKIIDNLSLTNKKISVLGQFQSNLFWDKVKNLEIFNNTKNSVLRIVIPPSECTNLIRRLKVYASRYYIDWAGSLIWVETNNLNKDILKEIRKKVYNASGYLTLIKSTSSLRSTEDVFTSEVIKFKIYEKIKKSFDPKRIINPGKMYIGI